MAEVGWDDVDMDIATTEEGAALVRSATRVVILSGAGISTASGIPDYRGPEGVWTKDPLAEKLSDVSFYLGSSEIRSAGWARALARAENAAVPNLGHRSVAAFEATGKLALVVTQNVDGLHLEAGLAPDKLVELHGDIRRVHCFSCGIITSTQSVLGRVRAGESDPHCEEVVRGKICGGILGTNIVRFGEYVAPASERKAKSAVSSCDLLLCVGTSLFVSTAISLVREALYDEKSVMIINGERTDYDDQAAAVLRGDINEVLPEVLGVDVEALQVGADARDRAEMSRIGSFMETLRTE